MKDHILTYEEWKERYESEKDLREKQKLCEAYEEYFCSYLAKEY